jgi:hypothetical protein
MIRPDFIGQIDDGPDVEILLGENEKINAAVELRNVIATSGTLLQFSQYERDTDFCI